jgi:hypothetical protein
MKKIMDLSHAGTAKIAIIVIALYALIGTITYFVWR